VWSDTRQGIWALTFIEETVLWTPHLEILQQFLMPWFGQANIIKVIFQHVGALPHCGICLQLVAWMKCSATVMFATHPLLASKFTRNNIHLPNSLCAFSRKTSGLLNNARTLMTWRWIFPKIFYKSCQQLWKTRQTTDLLRLTVLRPPWGASTLSLNESNNFFRLGVCQISNFRR
jgi:hypothetical protein